MRRLKLAAIVALSLGTLVQGVQAGEIGSELETAAPSGDLNRDGSTNSADLRLMQAVWSGQVTPRSVGVNRLDVNGDNDFNIEDVFELARLIRAEEERGEPQPRRVLLGDVNGDQRVDIADLYQLGRYVTGTLDGLRNPTAADIDGNGVIDIEDLTALAKQLGGSEWSYNRA